jgi:DNA adenine methylase
MSKPNKTFIKPFIKWVGGKTQIIEQVISEFPIVINNYHELFLGGGSVLLALLSVVKANKIKVNGKIYAYDINQTLINMYKNIQNSCDALILTIETLIEDYNEITEQNGNKKPKTIQEAKESKEGYYYWIRQSFNKMTQSEKNGILGSSYFIFLNKTCFRGLYREGPNGFNVPFGHYKNPEIIDKTHLKEVSELIKDVTFTYSGFDESFLKVDEILTNDDFVYLDPPYAPENDKSFVNYTTDGFNKEQHQKLFTLSKKYNFLMSNADVDFVKNEYLDKKYTIKIISCKRSINSKNPESKTNEVLIKSY